MRKGTKSVLLSKFSEIKDRHREHTVPQEFYMQQIQYSYVKAKTILDNQDLRICTTLKSVMHKVLDSSFQLKRRRAGNRKSGMKL